MAVFTYYLIYHSTNIIISGICCGLNERNGGAGQNIPIIA